MDVCVSEARQYVWAVTLSVWRDATDETVFNKYRPTVYGSIKDVDDLSADSEIAFVHVIGLSPAPNWQVMFKLNGSNLRIRFSQAARKGLDRQDFREICIQGYLIIFVSHHYQFNSMKTGKVKFFNEAKGYGFILEDETNKEIFVHHSGLTDKIRENDLVSYEVIEGRKGLNAVNVKKVQ